MDRWAWVGGDKTTIKTHIVYTSYEFGKYASAIGPDKPRRLKLTLGSISGP